MNYTATPLAETPHTEGSTSAFDAIDVLGLCRLYKRRPTLDGSIPMRGSYCKPFLDANSAGAHLQLVEPAMLDTSSGEPVLQLTDEELNRIGSGYEDRIRELAARGLIEPGGYWFRELIEGFATSSGSHLRLWTGWLVRPHRDGILISRAYNRRCLVDVREHVITPGGYVPLMLELDGESVYSPETWLDTDLAVLTPIASGLRIQVTGLAANPEVGRRVHGYFAVAELGKLTGRYRRMCADEKVTSSREDVCLITTVGPANAVRVREFDRYCDAAGVSESPPAGAVFEFAVVENRVAVSLRWDGSNLRHISLDPEDVCDECSATWETVYGHQPREQFAWWASYVLPLLGPQRAEPFLNILVHLFAETPAGWSCLVDGYSQPDLAGMRGVIATDVFHLAPIAFEIRGVGNRQVATGASLGRFLPVPRGLLESGFRQVPLSKEP
jgi:hypothetical protein